MAGATINPAVTAAARLDTRGGNSMPSSLVNSFRIAAVAEQLALHVLSPPKNDVVEFFNLCLSLSRGIDYAVANSEVPARVRDLPMLLKQVCQRRNDSLLQAAVMVLMISVKNACKNEWFPAKDSEELLTLADEIASAFCSVREMNTEVSSSLQTISTIQSRFYPQMKMGQILAFLEVKPGYGTFVIDFHISKSAKPSAEDKVRLFVAQTDNIETSSCIISPPKVNFLLNGKGVERRTNLYLDTVPQIPTVVTQMLKYGTNLLQVVGQFSGNYIIAIAYMSVVSSPDRHFLPDYVQPAVTATDTDSEIIEGPSRISLNCPMSFRRIGLPVKGHSCKHLQCFDFDNFMDVNSRRPSWRCPHCNQSVCYVDIRVDQNMCKILKEVGENVADVIISADGSWKAGMERNEGADQPHHETSNQQDGPVQHSKGGTISNAPSGILDLTEGEDMMEMCEIPDTKPILSDLQNQSSATNVTITPGMINTNEVNQNAAPIDDDFFSGIFLPTYGSGTFSSRSDAQFLAGVSGYTLPNCTPSPVLTDAVSPAPNREPEAFGSALLATPAPQSQISSPSNLQLQQSQHFGNSLVSNEYGSIPSNSIPRHINRTPIAVQALPAQTPSSVPQRSRSSFIPSIPQGPSLAGQTSVLPSIADGFSTISGNIERQQQFSRSHLNPLQSPLRATTQTWDHQDRSFISSQTAQRVVGLPASSQLTGAYRVPSASTTEHQNSRQQQHLNLRVPQGMSQTPSLVRSSTQPSPHFPRNTSPQIGTHSGAGQAALNSQRLMASSQRSPQMARQLQSVQNPVQTSRGSSFPTGVDGFRASVGDQGGVTGGTSQPATRTDGLAELPSEQNWRPTGRMRGSLSGQAYSAALNQYIILPTQPVQAPRPPLGMTSPPPGIPTPLHVLVSNSRNPHTSPVNLSPTEPSTAAGSSGVLLPEQSSGLP